MRIGVRGHDVEHSSLENLFENIGNQGFHCTQLALSKAVKEFKQILFVGDNMSEPMPEPTKVYPAFEVCNVHNVRLLDCLP